VIKGAIRSGGWRGWFLALAALALMVQVLVPPGFMLSADAAQPTLVICTGHGAITVSDRDHPAKAPKPGADKPCAFAAHGVATPPPQRLVLPGAGFAPTQQAQAVAFDLAPGRGLAAPPPPSRGPPSLPI
jgi:hypothetical protein